MKKTALVIGITGQDGAYLSQYLLSIGYRVVGTSRDKYMADLSRLRLLNIEDKIEIVSLAPNDFRSALRVVTESEPDEIYNLAGQTSVSLSFEQPVECMESIASATLNLLEVIKLLDPSIRFFNAGSSDCFGDTGTLPATESTPLNPCSPYAVAKSTSYWLVATYRQAYSLFACTGILSNHESPLRPNHFVSKKIINSVNAIRNGQQSQLVLGNLDISRDWGWAPDYVIAMHLMLQPEEPRDYIVSTGRNMLLRDFVDMAFKKVGLSSANYLQVSSTFSRPSEIQKVCVSPRRIALELGWVATTDTAGVIDKMLAGALS